MSLYRFLRRSLPYAFVLCFYLAGFVVMYVTRETNPAYMIYETTWDGQPAYGQYHRNGWYTFYAYTPSGPGPEIAYLPWGEAIHLR
jgi:hypothetical protein